MVTQHMSNLTSNLPKYQRIFQNMTRSSSPQQLVIGTGSLPFGLLASFGAADPELIVIGYPFSPSIVSSSGG